MRARWTLFLMVIILAAAAACSPVSPNPAVSTPTPHIDATVEHLVELTVAALPSPTAPPTATPAPTTVPDTGGSGAISGKLSYPSEVIPPLRVIAYAVGSNKFYESKTELNQATYIIKDVPAGVYRVVAYRVEGGPLAGGYSQAVPCGLSVDCTDHSLLDVVVQPGQVTTGIDPMDWYAPEGTFPPAP